MMIQKRTREIMQIIGAEDFAELFALFSKTWPNDALKLYQESERTKALHRLKGSCYAIGLDLIGKHIETVEEMLMHGAESTAREHFSLLIKEIEAAQQNIETLLSGDKMPAQQS